MQKQQQDTYLDMSNTVPRSRSGSDLNIVKILNKNFKYSRNLSSFDPDENNTSISDKKEMNTSVVSNKKIINASKSPSLNSILDTQTENLEKIKKQKEEEESSLTSSYYQNGEKQSVITRGTKNSMYKNNKVNRGSDYTTDSGIGGQGSLIDTYSHRSSIISQGSVDSGTQSNTSSNLNNNNISTTILNCSNYMRELSNNNNSEFLFVSYFIKRILLKELLNKLHKHNSFVFIN